MLHCPRKALRPQGWQYDIREINEDLYVRVLEARASLEQGSRDQEGSRETP